MHPKVYMETANRILQNADQLFRQAGIRSITMDDIARHLAMSKKTLYQHFSNKADIVNGVVQAHFEQEMAVSREIEAKAKDPVEELILLMKWMRKMWQEVPPTMVWDIQKYYPKSWSMFHDFKNGFVVEKLKNNLHKGKALGLYRPELDVDIMAKIRVEEIEILMNPILFPPDQYSQAVVHEQSFIMFIHGLVTIEGKPLIYKYLETED